MVKNKRQKLVAWAMTVMILFSAFSPVTEALAISPATLDAEVDVTGIEDGGIIVGSSSVGITVTFPVPVMGDGGDDYFRHGDEVTLLLSKSFKFDPIPTESIDLMYGSKKLGTVTLCNNAEDEAVAQIKFDGDEDVFDPGKLPGGEPPYSNVTGTFNADLKYNGTHDTDEDGNKTVSILEKTYKLQLPGDIITHTVEKKAEGIAVNLDEGTIEWTVTITATKDTKPDPTPIDLAGYVFEDDLKGVGEYIGGSFLLSSGTVVVANLTTPDATSSKLAYTFPSGSNSPQEITFKTTIPEDKMTSGGSITNAADLYLGDKKVGFDDYEVTISKPSATKWGETNDSSDGASYDPTGRTITWYVEIDNEGRTLNDLTITDELKGGLTLASAQWQKWNATENIWEDVSGVSWTAVPTGNQYKVGNVNYVGRLKIVSNVPDSSDGSVIAKTYYNQASLSWKGSGTTTGSAVTGNPGVGIGYDAISKSGTQSEDDVANHQITWTVNVDMKGQGATEFKVYDLFVHDASTLNSAITGATGWPSGLTIGASNITRNNGQKFVEVVSKGAHLAVTPIVLKEENGEVIGTLVEITGLQNSGSNQFVLKSQVLDPSIIAGNNPGQKVYNSASLYKNTTYRGEAGASVNYNNKILAKELLKRAEVGKDHSIEDSIDANNRTVNVADGFHYGYKEVIFRLNVNAAGGWILQT